MNETKQDANPKPEPGSPNLVTRRHFVQTAAATALMLPLVGRVGGAQVAGERERLAHLADYFQHFAENYLLDGDGLVRAWLSPATLLPISPDELSPRYEAYLRDMCQNSPDKAGALTYENALMATGEFAMSQIERYQRTGSKDAFALARKAMGGILAVSREGRNYMPGYLPKPWGGDSRIGPVVAACFARGAQRDLALLPGRRGFLHCAELPLSVAAEGDRRTSYSSSHARALYPIDGSCRPLWGQKVPGPSAEIRGTN